MDIVCVEVMEFGVVFEDELDVVGVYLFVIRNIEGF